MSSPKIPTPMEPLVEEDLITKPWYQYLFSSDVRHRPRVDQLTTESTGSNIYEGRITVFASTPGVVHLLEDPRIGGRTVLICNIPSTQGGSVTVRASTDVAIGPSGENGLTFLTSVSTYEYVELVGTSTAQYHILNQSTNVSVGASS